ncbi:hypothetical protein VTN96DRAFT_4815 [Rasamsonia emersonii]
MAARPSTSFEVGVLPRQAKHRHYKQSVSASVNGVLFHSVTDPSACGLFRLSQCCIAVSFGSVGFQQAHDSNSAAAG